MSLRRSHNDAQTVQQKAVSADQNNSIKLPTAHQSKLLTDNKSKLLSDSYFNSSGITVLPDNKLPHAQLGIKNVQSVESNIVFDMLRRGIPLLIALIGICSLIWSKNGAISSSYAAAIIACNYAISATFSTLAARISANALMASTLVGFMIRMVAIGLAAFLVRDQTWINWNAFCLTLVVSHLGLLGLELRHISATLAFPDLKPKDPSKGWK